jgi:hypothetical protein
MKNFIALAALPMMAAPAMAAPYVNVESNSGFGGSNYVGTSIESHLGVEGSLGGNVTGYAQLGPNFVLPDGGDSEVELSGKVGINVAATDNLGIYGEVWGSTTGGFEVDELLTNIKAGVKYTF